MKADYIIGICVSNDDPKNLGRIRAIPLTDLGTVATLNQVKNYVTQQDNMAEASKLYKPWVMVYSTSGNKDVYREKDKFLCEPYLPKNIGLTPNFGQLVKILKYDDNTQASEFIGPYTIDQITLTEQFYSVVSNLQKADDLTKVLPKKSKTWLSGYKNEQVIIGDDEFIARLDYIDTNKTKKTQYPFIQLSQFSNSSKMVLLTKNVDVTPDVAIDFICQLYISYTPKTTATDKNISGSLVLFDAKVLKNSSDGIGLTKKTFSNTNEYTTSGSDNYLVKHLINSNNFSDFKAIVDKIIASYENKNEVAYFNMNITSNIQTIENDKHTIIVTNKIPDTPNSGGAISPRNIISGLKNWIFRLNPNTNINNYVGTFTKPNLPNNNIETIKYNDYVALDSFIEKYKNKKEYGAKLKNNTPIFANQTDFYPEPTNKKQSTYITYADKFIFLSSEKNPNKINNTNVTDGLSSEDVARFLNRTQDPNKVNPDKTYGLIRGENLMELLKELVKIFKEHGHEVGVNPTGSLTKTSSGMLDAILQSINRELDVNSDGIIINHNFRHN